MTPRRRAARLLGVALVTTVAVTGLGVGLGSATPLAAEASTKKKNVASQERELPGGLAARAAVAVPDVASSREADFTNADGLPEGARVFNTGANRGGMALTDEGLGHGAAEAPGAAGFVETQLDDPVQRLGARVRFAEDASGSLALVAWQSSLVDADRAGEGTPATGMRLVASPGRWELTVVDGEVHVIGSGTYEVADGPATFELVRDGRHLYVVDPTGVVTQVDDKRADRLAGPWASWGLSETGPDQVPAVIQAVWAG